MVSFRTKKPLEDWLEEHAKQRSKNKTDIMEEILENYRKDTETTIVKKMFLTLPRTVVPKIVQLAKINNTTIPETIIQLIKESKSVDCMKYPVTFSMEEYYKYIENLPSLELLIVLGLTKLDNTKPTEKAKEWLKKIEELKIEIENNL